MLRSFHFKRMTDEYVLILLSVFSQATVVYNCSTQEKAYRAGRSNYFFMILLLGTFLLCLAAVAYGVTQ